jgi:hypothetical protein
MLNGETGRCPRKESFKGSFEDRCRTSFDWNRMFFMALVVLKLNAEGSKNVQFRKVPVDSLTDAIRAERKVFSRVSMFDSFVSVKFQAFDHERRTGLLDSAIQLCFNETSGIERFVSSDSL